MIDQQKISIALLQLQPWFGQQLGSLKIMRDDSVPTLSTNGVYLKYNQDYLNGLGFKYSMSGFAHEVVHCLKGDFARRMGRNDELWQMATDYIVNDILKKAGFALHPDWLWEARFSGMSSEEVYNILMKEKQNDNSAASGSGDGQAGTGEDSPGDDGSGAGAEGSSDELDGLQGTEGCKEGQQLPEDETSADGEQVDVSGRDEQGSGGEDRESPAEDTEPGKSEGTGDQHNGGDETSDSGKDNEHKVQRSDGSGGRDSNGSNPVCSTWNVGAVEDGPGNPEEQQGLAQEWENNSVAAYMVCKGMGSAQGFLQGEYEELLHPKQRWNDILRNAFMEAIKQEYTYRKPNRRSNHGIILPVVGVPYVSDIVIMVDCSGSMNKDALYKMYCEIAGIKDEIGDSKIHIVYFNHGVVQVEEDVELPYKPTIQPSGGTDYVQPFEWLSKSDIKCGLVCVYTDGDCWSYPSAELLPDCNVVWLGTRKFTPPFGEVIVIE